MVQWMRQSPASIDTGEVWFKFLSSYFLCEPFLLSDMGLSPLYFLHGHVLRSRTTEDKIWEGTLYLKHFTSFSCCFKSTCIIPI